MKKQFLTACFATALIAFGCRIWASGLSKSIPIVDVPYSRQGKLVLFDANNAEIGILLEQNERWLTVLTKKSFIVDLTYDGQFMAYDWLEMWLFPKPDCKGQPYIYQPFQQVAYPKRLLRHFQTEELFMPVFQDGKLVIEQLQFSSGSQNKYCRNREFPDNETDEHFFHMEAIKVQPVEWTQVGVPQIIKTPFVYKMAP